VTVQPGLSTYTYSWSIGVAGYQPAEPLTALGLLQLAVDLDVRVVQMADNLPLDSLSPAELDFFAAFASQHGIQIEVGTRGIDPTHLRCYLALAQRFASPILRVVVDTPSYHPSPTEVVEMLNPLRPEFEDAGVVLAIENHDRFPVRILAGFVRQLGPWTGICLDTVNSFGSLEGPQVVVETLGPLTVNLHVKEFTILRALNNMGFTIEGRPLGQGRLDVPWLLDELRQHGRDFNAIIELWIPPEPDLSDTIAKEQRWAAESVAYLRKIL
jgi:3-oxoisoapionate decarboxylase